MNHDAVPTVPGECVRNGDELAKIKNRIANLLNLRSYKFPGAQPVSFGRSHLKELESENYFVAEKSDGIRCLALLTANSSRGDPRVYLFDRKHNFYKIRVHFPLPNDATFKKCHNDTIIDGEFVLEKEDDGRTTMKFLLFDCLVCEGKMLTERDLMKRLGYLKTNVIRPHQAMLKKNKDLAKHMPFVVEFKEQQTTYHLDTVFEEIIPKLKHGNDGLIFTSVGAPYTLGTANTMIKWKPANENSVDFKVNLLFPPSSTLPGVYDYRARPRIELLVWHGGDHYKKYDELGITQAEWDDKFGDDPKKLQDTIIECNYDVEAQELHDLPSPWRFMRFRRDKPDGNHIKTVASVMNSIRDGVKKEELIEKIPDIRDAWKKRETEPTQKKRARSPDNEDRSSKRALR